MPPLGIETKSPKGSVTRSPAAAAREGSQCKRRKRQPEDRRDSANSSSNVLHARNGEGRRTRLGACSPLPHNIGLAPLNEGTRERERERCEARLWLTAGRGRKTPHLMSSRNNKDSMPSRPHIACWRETKNLVTRGKKNQLHRIESPDTPAPPLRRPLRSPVNLATPLVGNMSEAGQ